MSYVSLGLTTALAWFIAVDVMMSCLIVAAEPTLVRRRPSALTVAALRLAPLLAATLFVLLWVAPAYWQLEPWHTREAVGLTLRALAAAAVAVVATSIGRAILAIARTGRTVQTWSARSERIVTANCPIPTYADNGDSASVSLVGVIRPRLFIGERVRAALTPEELSAVVAHELAHRSTFDNFTRLLFASCCDVVSFTAAGRRLEQRWKALAEESADARALSGNRRTALHLASALVKVARLVPPQAPLPVLCSGLHDTDQDALLPLRVRRLLAPDLPSTTSSFPVLALTLILVAGAVLCAPAARPLVHETTELFVRILP